MLTYETVFAVSTEISEEERSVSITQVEDLIKQLGGEVTSSDSIGERQMAYQVKGHDRAYYHLIRFDSPPNVIDELKKNYSINSRFLRNIIIKNK